MNEKLKEILDIVKDITSIAFSIVTIHKLIKEEKRSHKKRKR